MSYRTVDEFLAALDQMERPLAVIAHQDDEVTFAGLLARCGDRARIVWVTNGDGLYFQTDLTPKEYGEIRKAEAIRSAAAIGITADRNECLDYSEVEIYRRMAYITQNAAAALWLRPFFQRIVDDIRDRIFAIHPECVFTCAYQGGNPEHDLTHYFTRLALDEYERATGAQVPLFHVPMYEYIILVAQRFNPLYPGLRWRYHLREQEMIQKRALIECYPSQIELFHGFEKMMRVTGVLSLATRGHRLTLEEYLAEEEFGPVARDWNYLRNPHTFDAANYIGDHFHGVPVTFDGSVRPIVASLPRVR